jgi:hypothetical protein
VPEVVGAFRRTGIAQAGVIVSAEPDGQYLVQLFGRRTVPLPGAMLQPAGPISVDTSSGTATSLAEIETRLVDAVARTRISEHRDWEPDNRDIADIRTLSFELARICGLPRSTLLAQLESAIGARMEGYQLADGVRQGQDAEKPTQVAAKDGSPRRSGERRLGRASRTADRAGTARPSPRHRR